MKRKDKIQVIKLKCGVEVLVDFERKMKCPCGEDIWFGKTKKGGWMPIYLCGLAEWDTHYANCPLGNTFRKGAK
jgi:hypothetical protein